MRRIRLLATTLLALLAIGVLYSTAAASAEEWKMNAKGLGTSPTGELETNTVKVKAAVLEIKGVTTVTCQNLQAEKIKLLNEDELKGGTLKFIECAATAPCKLVKTSITTKPVIGKVEAGTAPETILTITPAEKEIFANVEFEGPTCSLAGTQPVKGKVKAKDPKGQTELKKQLLEVKSTGELKVGANEASLEGAAEDGLTDKTEWSWTP
jgi:hypothetical protein